MKNPTEKKDLTLTSDNIELEAYMVNENKIHMQRLDTKKKVIITHNKYTILDSILGFFKTFGLHIHQYRVVEQKNNTYIMLIVTNYTY